MRSVSARARTESWKVRLIRLDVTTSNHAVHLQLRTLAAFAPIGIFQGDAEANFIFVNQSWLDISGLTLEESLGDGWTRCVHPEDLPKLIKSWKQAVAQQTSFESKYRLIRPSGESSPYSFRRGHHVSAPENGAVCFIGCAEDVTDQQGIRVSAGLCGT